MASEDLLTFMKHELLNFLDEWFGLTAIEEQTAVMLVLLTVTHVLSVLMMIFSPFCTSCYGFFGAFTFIEIAATLIWYLTLQGLYYFHKFDATHSRTIVNLVHYLHFIGIMWIPALTMQWYMCIEGVSIPRVFGTKPPRVVSYAPLPLNSCISNGSNFYTAYKFRHIEILMATAIIGGFHSLYLFIVRQAEDRMMDEIRNQIEDEIGASGRSRYEQGRMESSYSVSNRSPDPYGCDERRPLQGGCGSSSSDDQIPSNRFQQHQVEVHCVGSPESEV